MIIELEDKLYRLRVKLNDINIKEYDKINKFIKEQPQWIKNILQEVEDDVDYEVLFEFEKKVVAMLSDIPKELLDKCAFGDVHLCFEEAKEIILSCLKGIYSDTITFFTWGERFNAPKKDTDITGVSMYCSEITALQMCEASDLQIATGYQYANNIISILFCDKYDEKECKNKAKWLQDLPMSIAAGCMAHLSLFHEYCRKNYPNVYGGRGKETPLSGFGWGGRILWLAGSVENVEKVNNMNAYEFIRQLSYKIAENES